MNCEMRLRYTSPAPVIDDFLPYSTFGSSWERYSLPLGNGFFGANVFGRLDEERIQISDPTLANPYYIPKTFPRRRSCASGVNSMAELIIKFDHNGAENYERCLSLDDAVHTVQYTYRGVDYRRTCFTSHPDRALVMRVEANRPGAVSLKIDNIIPFTGDYNLEPGDGMAKSGEVVIENGEIVARGCMQYYGILYESRVRLILTGGEVVEDGVGLRVQGADTVDIIFTCATNYELSERVFLEETPSKKLAGTNPPTDTVRKIITSVAAKGYEELLRTHKEDYHSLYKRVSLDFGQTPPDCATDVLLAKYKAGERSPYLEVLLYQYGRYLMISSSRTLLPAHLQGIWNAFSDSPWSCGYWHNINQQMNYWSVGTANLCEMFIPYINYAKAYMPMAKKNADDLIAKSCPEKLSSPGENGWIIGTGAWAYKISEFESGDHSGPGTGAFTALLFWDHYEYTRDVEFLRDFAYPTLYSMSTMYTKLLVKVGDVYLIPNSASPENVQDGKYYQTVGCGFDQQMVYECFHRTIRSAKILGIYDPFINELEKMLPHLEPVLIGDDGQVKEYREESGYSSIGEPNHRHISHLVGLYPGTIINEEHPDWMEAARVTLRKRGDTPHGWACIHRLLLWARIFDARHSMDTLVSFISHNIMENLWDWQPPFQIDGNFGYVAAVGEMLVGGYDGNVRVLPALPEEWGTGEFRGIASRGGLVLNCRWENGVIVYLDVIARSDTVVNILIPDGSRFNDGILPTQAFKTGERRVLIGSDK